MLRSKAPTERQSSASLALQCHPVGSGRLRRAAWRPQRVSKPFPDAPHPLAASRQSLNSSSLRLGSWCSSVSVALRLQRRSCDGLRASPGGQAFAIATNFGLH